MIRTILIKTGFIAAVLLMGQFPVNDLTLGEVFLRQVKRLVSWGGGELQKNRLVASLGKELREISSEKKAPSEPAKKEREESSTPDAEGMTPADKEALLRLLE